MKFAGTAEATKLALQLLTELFLCLISVNHENHHPPSFVEDFVQRIIRSTSFASALFILKKQDYNIEVTIQ